MEAKQNIVIPRETLLQLVRDLGYDVSPDARVLNEYGETLYQIEIVSEVRPMLLGVPLPLVEKLRALWDKGQKIRAIKELRSEMGWGLYDSKRWAERVFGPLVSR